MEKVICDVCGIAYPETAAQCPICGCARTENGQTSACDTVQVEAENGYSATRGGRFSKSNVRKRLKAAQVQPVPLEIAPRAPKVEEPEPQEDEDYEEYDEDDDDEMPATNRGLILVVVLLLLAIIAVASYIFIDQLGLFDSPQNNKPSKNPTVSTTAPTSPTEDPALRIPCTGVELTDSQLTLGGDVLTMQLSYSVDPIDTTDDLSFTSSDPSIASVDSRGNVTVVGDGVATITVKCGDISKTCQVTCVMDGDVPDVPDVPDEPMPDLQLRMTDASFNAKGYQWRAYKNTEGFDASKFTWEVDDENIATVDNGIVTVLAPGRTTLRVYYGQEEVATCIIRCNWTEEPEVPDEPENPEEPETPEEPAETYLIRINGLEPYYLHNNQPNTAEVSQKIGEKFKLTLVDGELEEIMTDVQWTLSKVGVCEFDGTYVTGVSKGNCYLTAEYKGVTYRIYIIINA